MTSTSTSTKTHAANHAVRHVRDPRVRRWLRTLLAHGEAASSADQRKAEKKSA